MSNRCGLKIVQKYFSSVLNQVNSRSLLKISICQSTGRSIATSTSSMSPRIAPETKFIMSSTRLLHSTCSLNRSVPSSRPTFKSENLIASRPFSTERPEQGSAEASTNLSLKAVSALLVSAAGLFVYFNYTKHQMAAAPNPVAQSAGTPLVGGPFALVDYHGNPVTQDFLLGKYSIIYFGYTFCPDVCPEELEKITRAVDHLGKFIYSDSA